VLDNFVRTAEWYWRMPGVFRLRVWLKGRNDDAIDRATRDLFGDGDRLTVRFATMFLPYKFNQMYKSNPVQFNNFSTMTTDGTHWHEVGHAFGLDDEYGGETRKGIDKKNGCDNEDYQALDPQTYQMCNPGTTERRRIYPYIAVSRYVTDGKE
jgi:hypothetical protein